MYQNVETFTEYLKIFNPCCFKIKYHRMFLYNEIYVPINEDLLVFTFVHKVKKIIGCTQTSCYWERNHYTKEKLPFIKF